MVEVRKNFKFSEVTANNLKKLVEEGFVRNETEGVDLAVMHFLTEKRVERKTDAPSLSSSEPSEARA